MTALLDGGIVPCQVRRFFVSSGAKGKAPGEGRLERVSTELALWACVLPAGMHPLELAKLFLGHLGAVLVKHDGAILQGIQPLDLFRRQRSIGFQIIGDYHRRFSFLWV